MNFKDGDKAPVIEGLNYDDYKGKRLILYFYPKDNTPGCTNQACNLRDNYEDLKKEGFEVVGVSPDSEKSHEKFIAKHNLPFQLIADTEKEALNSFGAWGEKKMYGKTYEGVLRTTFVIKDGMIEKIFKKVKTKEHTEQILKEYK